MYGCVQYRYKVLFIILDSRTHGKQLHQVAEVEDINDPLYQMQREAFTIQKEALSDFKVIGKDLRVCVCVSVCVSVCVGLCL